MNIRDLSLWAIYLDLDGVFADYDTGIRWRGFENIDPNYKNTLNRSGTGNPMKRMMHDAIKGTTFYRNLPLLPGSEKLYRHVAPAKPIILTAAPKFGATEDDYYLNPHWLGAAYHKRWWVEHVLLPQSLPERREKWGMMVDDYRDVIPIEDERFICTTSARKHEFIHRKPVLPYPKLLIDDRRDNCVRWARAGGTAILHTSPGATIVFIEALRTGEAHEIRDVYQTVPGGGRIAGCEGAPRTWAEMETEGA